MSQPAVSNALRRLRHLFNDELFVRVPGGIRPTAKASEIWPDLQSAVDQLRAIALPQAFSPAGTTVTFNLAITDTLVSRVLPALALRLVSDAPLAKLCLHLHSTPNSTGGLERGTIDCAVGMFPTAGGDLRMEGVLADDYVCIFRRGHPELHNPLTLKDFVAARHVLVKQATWQAGIVDGWLSLEAEHREITLVVNRAEDAIKIVRRTDLAAAVPRSYVLSVPDVEDLEVADLPFQHEKILYKMVWHERTERDAARIWFRSIVRDAIVATCAGGHPAPPGPPSATAGA